MGVCGPPGEDPGWNEHLPSPAEADASVWEGALPCEEACCARDPPGDAQLRTHEGWVGGEMQYEIQSI